MSTKNDDITPSGTAGIPTGEGLGATPCSLDPDEVKLLRDALWAARSDIHRRGLDESYLVHKQICEAQKMLASKANVEVPSRAGCEIETRESE